MVCTQPALAGQVAHTQGAGTQAAMVCTRAETQTEKAGTRSGTQSGEMETGKIHTLVELMDPIPAILWEL